jgi:hypothetical protein
MSSALQKNCSHAAKLALGVEDAFRRKSNSTERTSCLVGSLGVAEEEGNKQRAQQRWSGWIPECGRDEAGASIFGPANQDHLETLVKGRFLLAQAVGCEFRQLLALRASPGQE